MYIYIWGRSEVKTFGDSLSLDSVCMEKTWVMEKVVEVEQ